MSSVNGEAGAEMSTAAETRRADSRNKRKTRNRAQSGKTSIPTDRARHALHDAAFTVRFRVFCEENEQKTYLSADTRAIVVSVAVPMKFVPLQWEFRHET